MLLLNEEELTRKRLRVIRKVARVKGRVTRRVIKSLLRTEERG